MAERLTKILLNRAITPFHVVANIFASVSQRRIVWDANPRCSSGGCCYYRPFRYMLRTVCLLVCVWRVNVCSECVCLEYSYVCLAHVGHRHRELGGTE